MATSKSGRKSGAKSSARGGAKKASARGGAKKASAKGGARGGAKKASAKGGARKAGAKKAGARKSAAKRAPNPAFMRPMQPDAQLGAVVGDRPMPRTEITKRLWEYIKRNNLQDAKERRMINADDKLRPLFGKSRVSMFDMTKIVNEHMKPGA
jgi:chromatin remodeling complex protein RSC6